jgi:hypothetical protein
MEWPAPLLHPDRATRAILAKLPPPTMMSWNGTASGCFCGSVLSSASWIVLQPYRPRMSNENDVSSGLLIGICASTQMLQIITNAFDR